MAFAAGSSLFVSYVRANATVGPFAGVLQNVGSLIGIGVLVGAFVLRDPPDGWLADIETDATETTDVSENTTSKTRGWVGTIRPTVRWREVVRT